MQDLAHVISKSLYDELLLQVSTIIAVNTKCTNTQRHPPKYKITREMGKIKNELLGLGDNYWWYWSG